MLLNLAISAIKTALRDKNGGQMKLSSEGRKSRAVKSFCAALDRRGWIPGVAGVYTHGSVTVDTRTQDFTVLVQDRFKTYVLALGKGAIKNLDQYMRLRDYQI